MQILWGVKKRILCILKVNEYTRQRFAFSRIFLYNSQNRIYQLLQQLPYSNQNKTDLARKTKSVCYLKLNYSTLGSFFVLSAQSRTVQIEVSSKIGFNNITTVDVKVAYSGYKCVKFAEMSSVVLLFDSLRKQSTIGTHVIIALFL